MYLMSVFNSMGHDSLRPRAVEAQSNVSIKCAVLTNPGSTRVGAPDGDWLPALPQTLAVGPLAPNVIFGRLRSFMSVGKRFLLRLGRLARNDLIGKGVRGMEVQMRNPLSSVLVTSSSIFGWLGWSWPRSSLSRWVGGSSSVWDDSAHDPKATMAV